MTAGSAAPGRADSGRTAGGNIDPAHTGPALPGYLALAGTVVIWAAFALSARSLAASSLTAADGALLRYGVPLLVLAPTLWNRRRMFRSLRWGPALKIVCGAGVPYFLVTMWGASLTSAAFVGALIPGLVPLFVSVLMLARGVALPQGTQRAGLALTAVGAFGLVGEHLIPLAPAMVAGCGMLVLSSGLWALYTVGLRETNLDPIAAIGLLCGASLVVTCVLTAAGALPSNIADGTADWFDILSFAAVQGVAVGVLSAYMYAYAIRRVGAQFSALAGSLSPAISTLLAIPLLSEVPSVATWLGILVIMVGVTLANRPARTLTSGRPQH